MKKTIKSLSIILFVLIIGLKISDLSYVKVFADSQENLTLEEEERKLQKEDEEAKKNAKILDFDNFNSVQLFSNKSNYVERIHGNDRVATSSEISRTAYKKGSKTVVLAAYTGNADALSGTPLAASENAPLLLVHAKGISSELEAEIKRLGASKAIILGGEAVVPNNIISELKELGLSSERISGINRFHTAAKLAEKASNPKHIFLTLGISKLPDGTDDALADALSIGPVSAKEGKPVLLTKRNELPKETKDAIINLGVKNVTVVGGENAVSLKVKNELKSMGITVDEVSGTNRYETAVKIAEKYFTVPENLIVANGIKDADALVGGYLGALKNAPVILVHPTIDLKETRIYLENFKIHTYILGGESVISKNIYNTIETILNSPMICLDYGHGGRDSGAPYKGRLEKDDVLKIGKLVADRLRKNGIRVDETRTTDKYVYLTERSDFSNKKDYDYFISFHRDAYKPEEANGVTTFVHPQSSPKSANMAKVIQKNLVKIGFRDRKVKTANFHVLRETNAPAVLMEIGFIDNTADNELYDRKHTEIVNNITSAILDVLNQ